MDRFIKRLTNAARRFTAFDFAVFKIYILALGILIGAYWWQLFMRNIFAVWCVVVATGIYILAILWRNRRD